ncbi:MAG: hypothetical protein ACRD2F_12730 [Terriglobales bacterium]
MPKPSPPNAPGVSRRSFGGRLLALTGGLAVAGSAEALTAATARPLAAPAPGGVEAKLANVIARWGPRLSASQRRRLHGIIGYHQTMLERLRAMPLTNADPPATVLKDRQ